MKRNKKQNMYLILGIMILAVTLGYAALAATLKINGTLDVAKTSWDVHFENVSITPKSVTATTEPTSDNTTTTEMEYTVDFTKPGDFYEFTVDMVNKGTINAMITSVSNKVYQANGTTERTLPEYLKSTVTYDDGIAIAEKHKLDAGASEKIKVRVEFRKDIEINQLPSSGAETIKFKFAATFEQADNTAKDKPQLITLQSGKTKDTLTVGDDICINGDTRECFDFIKYDGNNIVMLAQYNLNVGNNPKGSETFLQDSDVKGYVSSGTKYGNVAFSSTNYWSSLGLTYPADVYDNTYKTAPDFSGDGYSTTGYSVAYYVEEYKKKLVDYGATISEARLLTYSEATDSSIGCSSSSYSCPTDGFITNTSFWLGSAGDNNGVWSVLSRDDFSRSYFIEDSCFGVRPVVVISKSNI